jgi:hypothetical protein
LHSNASDACSITGPEGQLPTDLAPSGINEYLKRFYQTLSITSVRGQLISSRTNAAWLVKIFLN